MPHHRVRADGCARMLGGEPVWDDANPVSDEVGPGWRDVARRNWATAQAREVGAFYNLVKKLEDGGARARGVTQDDGMEELADAPSIFRRRS